MKFLFADTFYFLAIINPQDAFHAAAVDFGKADKTPMLTTTWVLTEVADALAKTENRHLARQLYLDLRDAAVDVIVPCSTALLERGFELHHRRPDKTWSLTDCISFVVMQDHGLGEALTGERHFAQAGFIPLLATP